MNAPTPPIASTLLFIPDISGFTQFVNTTEITHSRHITQELLETLIDANELDLLVSEIEGDAVLFYREGSPPTAAALLAQVQRMFVGFHAHLRRYETHRICHCGACNQASGLTLKFIVHYGKVGRNQIKSHTKLFGRDVIVAHRLLKNEIAQDEYVLLTSDVIDACAAAGNDIRETSWAEPEQGEANYDVGRVIFSHIPLAPLHAQVPEPAVENYALPGPKMEVMVVESVIDAPADLVFDVLSDLSFRHHWKVGLKDSDHLNHKIPMQGATHRCVMKYNESDPLLVSHDFRADENLITFTDTERKQGWCSVYLLRRVGKQTTKLEEHMFLKKSALAGLLFRLFMRRKLYRLCLESYERMNTYCKDLQREGREHPSRIVLRS